MPSPVSPSREEDLRKVVAFGPEHISTYCLTFEEDTTLWTRLQKGEVERRSEAEEVAFYETSWGILEAAGYEQYEVSNYARPGFACRHNCDTWRMQEWIGYGPAASGQLARRRYTNTPDLRKWREGVISGQLARIDEVSLDSATLAADALVFGLRMNAGVNRGELRERFPLAPWRAYDELARDFEDEGLMSLDAGQWRLTPAGRLVADGIGGQFIEV